MTNIKHPEITVQLSGQDGNAFMILGLCTKISKPDLPLSGYEDRSFFKLLNF